MTTVIDLMKKVLGLAVLVLIAPPLSFGEGLKVVKEEGFYVYYSGTITLSGKFSVANTHDFQADVLCFYPDPPTSRYIPREKGDERIAWFCFENQAKARRLLKVPSSLPVRDCGFIGHATISVSSYVVTRESSEVWDTAILDRVISSNTPKKVTECQQQ